MDLEQDPDDADRAPFLFTQFKLANMLDPKDLELEALGGINALLKGLGTNPTRRLGSKALMGSDGRPGPGEGVSQRHDREEQNPLPGIVVTAPDNLESGKEPAMNKIAMKLSFPLLWINAAKFTVTTFSHIAPQRVY